MFIGAMLMLIGPEFIKMRMEKLKEQMNGTQTQARYIFILLQTKF